MRGRRQHNPSGGTISAGQVPWHRPVTTACGGGAKAHRRALPDQHQPAAGRPDHARAWDRAGTIILYATASSVGYPKPAQDAILRLCQQALAPNGVAQSVTMSFRAGTCGRLSATSACATQGMRARRSAGDEGARRPGADCRGRRRYGRLWQTAADRGRAAEGRAGRLHPGGVPRLVQHTLYIQDFIARTAAADLDYLCEADCLPRCRRRSMQRSAADSSQPAGVARPSLEQDIDFLTGRLFRRSVLVRRHPATPHADLPDPRVSACCTLPAACAVTRPQARMALPSSTMTKGAR